MNRMVKDRLTDELLCYVVGGWVYKEIEYYGVSMMMPVYRVGTRR